MIRFNKFSVATAVVVLFSVLLDACSPKNEVAPQTDTAVTDAAQYKVSD